MRTLKELDEDFKKLGFVYRHYSKNETYKTVNISFSTRLNDSNRRSIIAFGLYGDKWCVVTYGEIFKYAEDKIIYLSQNEYIFPPHTHDVPMTMTFELAKLVVEYLEALNNIKSNRVRLTEIAQEQLQNNMEIEEYERIISGLIERNNDLQEETAELEVNYGDEY